jgi:hypothetical protein
MSDNAKKSLSNHKFLVEHIKWKSMKVCVVTRGRVKGAVLPPCDIALFGFGALGEVDYESEIAGKSEKFGEVATLTRLFPCGVVCGCKTKGGGLSRISAAIADGGKLIGITDCSHVLDGESFKSGAGLGLYCLHGIKTGMCVAGDIYFPECIKALTLCGCHLIVGLSEECRGVIPLLIRSYAYLYGVPIVMVAGKTAFLSDIDGNLVCSPLDMTVFDIVPRNEYRVVTSRRRGISDFASEDY